MFSTYHNCDVIKRQVFDTSFYVHKRVYVMIKAISQLCFMVNILSVVNDALQ